MLLHYHVRLLVERRSLELMRDDNVKVCEGSRLCSLGGLLGGSVGAQQRLVNVVGDGNLLGSQLYKKSHTHTHTRRNISRADSSASQQHHTNDDVVDLHVREAVRANLVA